MTWVLQVAASHVGDEYTAENGIDARQVLAVLTSGVRP